MRLRRACLALHVALRGTDAESLIIALVSTTAVRGWEAGGAELSSNEIERNIYFD